MHESDLRLHVAKQTDLHIGAIHLTSYADLPNHYATSPYDALILDALSDADLQAIGRTILTPPAIPTFAIGSGGLSKALATALTNPPPPAHHTATTPPAKSSNQPRPSAPASDPAPAGHPTTRPTNHAMPGRDDRARVGDVAGQVLVVSGSQSLRTAEQIAHAVASGWQSRPLTYPPAAAPDDSPAVALEAVEALKAGAPGVVVHTGEATGRPTAELLGALSKELAAVVREVVRTTQVRTVVVAGGDTSGRVLRDLGVTALEPLPTTPSRLGQGLTLCTAISGDPRLNGVRFLLKGGQLGEPNLFVSLRLT